MAMAAPSTARMSRGGAGASGLADVLDVLLDKGLVIDAFVRVSLVGIELLTIDARIVVASVDTYLRFAEAVNRLDLTQVDEGETLPEMISGEGREDGSRGDRSGDSKRHLESGDGGRRSSDRAGSGEEEEEEGGGLMSVIGKAAHKVVERSKYS